MVSFVANAYGFFPTFSFAHSLVHLDIDSPLCAKDTEWEDTIFSLNSRNSKSKEERWVKKLMEIQYDKVCDNMKQRMFETAEEKLVFLLLSTEWGGGGEVWVLTTGMNQRTENRGDMLGRGEYMLTGSEE